MFVAKEALPASDGYPSFSQGERIPDRHPQISTWVGQGKLQQDATPPGSDFADSVFDRPDPAVDIDGGTP